MSTLRSPTVDVDVVDVLDERAREEVPALLQRAQETDGYPSLSDQALLSLRSSASCEDPAHIDAGRTPVTDSRASMLFLLGRASSTRSLWGFAILERRFTGWDLEMAINPEQRLPAVETGGDVTGALLDAALAEVAVRGGGNVQAWGRRVDSRTEGVMAARGLRKARELLQLRAPLPPEAAADASSPPVPVRPFRPGRDEAAWIDVNRRAFADHPDQSAWTRDDLAQRESEPWFDPHGFLLHEVDGRLAAFCWTKVHRSPVLGEIYVIGVDPDFQGRGLGRALTRAGLGHLAARGISTAMLYAEATNTPALVMYRSLGFLEHHREVAFTCELSPGPVTSS